MTNTTVRVMPKVERELQRRVRSRALRADDVRRARLILMLADGQSFSVIRETLGCNRSYITRWKNRFLEDGLSGSLCANMGETLA